MPSTDLAIALADIARILQSKNMENLDWLGIGPGQKRILFVVIRAPGIKQAAISQRLGIHKSVISRAVKVLVKAGYIRRKLRFGKREARPLFPTRMAIALMKHIESLSDSLEKEMTSGFSDQEVAQLKKQLQRVMHNLSCQPRKTSPKITALGFQSVLPSKLPSKFPSVDL